MDYFDILKKAWRITWKYKALWVLGLFVGAGGGSSSGGSGGSGGQTGGSESLSGGADVFRGFGQWVTENAIFIAVLAGLLVVIGLIFWILSVAAQGGLVHAANEAAEDRRPSLGEAWSVGFARWGRTFMIGFVLGLPILIVVLVMVGVLAAAGAGGALSQSDVGIAGALGSACLLLPLFVVLLVVGGVIIGILSQLAVRYGVLEDVTFGKAISRSWSDLWAKKGAWIFWLVMMLPGFAYAIAVMVVVLPLAIPAVFMFIAEKYVMGVGMLVLLVLAMMLPNAIYGTFVSSAWTVFFRRMTGREPGGVATHVPAGSFPGQPYAPAPPMPDAPPAAPAFLPEEAPVVDVPPPPPSASPGDA